MIELVALARLAQFVGVCVLLGAPLTFAPLRPAPAGARGLILAAAAVALAAGVASLALQTAVMTGDPAAAADPQMLRTVFAETVFGRAVATRAGLCLLVLAAAAPRTPNWTLLAALGAAAMVSFAWSGHGAADEGAAGLVHLGADIAHLLAAGVWLGALAAFLLMLLTPASRETGTDLRTALERFSGVGSGVVAVLLLSGLLNSWFLVGPARLGGLFTTDYGRLLLAKLALFATMLGLAALNRFRLTPALARRLQAAGGGGDLAALRRSLAVETLLGVLVLAAVAVMGALAPLSAQ
jgi:putative copper resistance protein D